MRANKSLQRLANLQKKQFRQFGSVQVAYDWRDDPKYNPDLTKDCRDNGWNADTYSYPYNKAHDYWYFPQFPENYDFSNLKQNLRPEFKPSRTNFNGMPATYSSYDADVAHEYDYESEDLDFQCESFDMQHFRKKGPISQWYICGMLPLIYFYLEFFYQHGPDEDYWRKPVPPPLNYPDPLDTDDTDTVKCYNSKQGRYLEDSGIIGHIWYDIIDGKKVYKRFAGVNQPMEIF